MLDVNGMSQGQIADYGNTSLPRPAVRSSLECSQSDVTVLVTTHPEPNWLLGTTISQHSHSTQSDNDNYLHPHAHLQVWHSRSAVLDPHAVLAQTSVCVRLNGATDAAVRSIHMAGCFIGLALDFSAAAGSKNITVENCSFQDIRTPYGAVQPSTAPWGTAIRVGMSKSSQTLLQAPQRS